MEMQDMDFDLVYEPRKDEADPLDFLSRHPLPNIGYDKTEKIIRLNARCGCQMNQRGNSERWGHAAINQEDR